ACHPRDRSRDPAPVFEERVRQRERERDRQHRHGGDLNGGNAPQQPAVEHQTLCSSPPSTASHWPVMYPARSLHKNAAAAAISSGVPSRAAGTPVLAASCAGCSEPLASRARSVPIRPGRTLLRVTLSAATWRAIVLNAATIAERWALDSIRAGIGSM